MSDGVFNSGKIIEYAREKGLRVDFAQRIVPTVLKHGPYLFGWFWFNVLGMMTRAPKEMEQQLPTDTALAWRNYADWSAYHLSEKEAEELERIADQVSDGIRKQHV